MRADPSMALFDMDEAMTFSVTDEGFRRGDGRVVPWHDIGGFTTYLDTMGGRDAVANSYACAVVVVWEPLLGGGSMNPDSLSGVNGYVMLAWLERAPLTVQMENAILLSQRAEAMLAPAVPQDQLCVRAASGQGRNDKDVNRPCVSRDEGTSSISGGGYLSRAASEQGRPDRNARTRDSERLVGVQRAGAAAGVLEAVQAIPVGGP